MTIHITRASQQAKLYIICNVHACVLHAKAQTSLLCSLAKLNLRRVKVWLRKTVRGQCVHERHAGDSASLLSPTKLARTTGCSAIQRAGRRKLPHLPPLHNSRASHCTACRRVPPLSTAPPCSRKSVYFHTARTHSLSHKTHSFFRQQHNYIILISKVISIAIKVSCQYLRMPVLYHSGQVL